MTALTELLTTPRRFVARALNKARRARIARRADPATKRFIAHNRRVWRDWAVANADTVILADFYTVAETNVARSYFLNVLARKHRAAIYSFQHYGGDAQLRDVYRSFNTVGHIVPDLTAAQKARRDALVRTVMPSLRSKQEVYDLTVSGIWIGVDIYESYLRDYGKPTVYVDDPNFMALVELAIGLLIFWQDEFSKPRRIAAVVASHSCYVGLGIVSKVAWANQVPVYAPGPIHLICSYQAYDSYSHFGRYRELFHTLTHEEQVSGIALAQRQLERRFSGEAGVDMPYSTNSAFGAPRAERVLRDTDRIKVLICTHCFFDNPHAYGGMLFVDFFEWIRYLGKMAERTNYDWYLKTHPNPLAGTREAVRQLLAEFPKITLVPDETSHHQLAAEGVDFVLTAYGSVGHEYPALGVQVINAGYNPHVAYPFNLHAASLDEYESHLLDLPALKASKRDVCLTDVAEFYFMHYYYHYDDSFVFTSYRQFVADTTREQRIGSASYQYFLDELTDDKHTAIIDAMQAFIDSGKRHCFSRGPV